MVARDDDRPTLVAHVDPSRCVSCGICAGSCAPMGVGPPGRTGRDQLAAARSTWLTDVAAGEDVPVIAICCEQAPPSQLAALAAGGAQIHSVPCVGNLHSSLIELLVRWGAPGVLVCGCPPRDCVGREGPKWLRERLFNGREADLQPRVDRRRVGVTTLAPGDFAATVATFTAFKHEVEQLQRPERQTEVDLDVLCEPVPLEEEVS
jgi:coenzyme F420-reducing hydrogenase delta subunit